MGQGTSNNGQYTANITDYYNTGLIALGPVSASYVAGSSISGTLTEAGLNEMFDGMAIPASEFNYNFFNVQMTFGGTPCLFPNEMATGVAIDYLLSDGITRQLLAGITSGNFGTIFVANSGQFFPGSNTITALQVTPASATIPPGTTQQYTATATYGDRTTADVTSQVNWSTSPTSVATIASGGLLTGVSLGTATVRAQSGGVIATTLVTISQKQITSISIQPLTQTLNLSLGPTTIQFTATATYRDGTTGDVSSIAT